MRSPSALKMGAEGSSEMLVTTYQTISSRNIQEHMYIFAVAKPLDLLDG
jgi:hypothetical protein